MRWRKAALIGVGLLGGSLGLALKRRGLAGEVWGYVRRESSLRECLEAGAVDQATMRLEGCVRGAELVVFCTPLAQMPVLGREMAQWVEKEAVITDVGSAKAELVREMEEIFLGGQFVGSHPMAGSEKMGVKAAKADLFENACCVVTPTGRSRTETVAAVDRLWTSVGGRVMHLEPRTHDEFVARSSHLPHVVAAQLAHLILDPKFPEEQRKLCANGFKDSTRIASGSPEMWRDIVCENRKQVLKALAEFREQVGAFAVLLERNDAIGIEKFFAEAKARRDGWQPQQRSSSSSE